MFCKKRCSYKLSKNSFFTEYLRATASEFHRRDSNWSTYLTKPYQPSTCNKIVYILWQYISFYYIINICYLGFYSLQYLIISTILHFFTMMCDAWCIDRILLGRITTLFYQNKIFLTEFFPAHIPENTFTVIKNNHSMKQLWTTARYLCRNHFVINTNHHNLF